ncbi:MAG: acyl-CoA thioesterase [Calditrichaeota bacterium]|nr:MAG: acyl-CoA thioesterase [Calditrichota bacterium]
MFKNSKPPSASRTEVSRIVRPLDANTMGTGYGGYIMDWMDMTASICARRHSNLRVNTVSVENLRFDRPLIIGHVAKIIASVTRTFNTSMEVMVSLFDEDTFQSTIVPAGSAVFILVGMDQNCKPVRVPDLIPETDAEKALWKEAGKRRVRRNKGKH